MQTVYNEKKGQFVNQILLQTNASLKACKRSILVISNFCKVCTPALHSQYFDINNSVYNMEYLSKKPILLNNNKLVMRSISFSEEFDYFFNCIAEHNK